MLYFLGIAEEVRDVFLGIASMIYYLLEQAAQLFFDVSVVELLDNATVSAIYQRVGLILGLFMLFKLTFSFIQMVVDPDQMTDKNNGIGSVIKKLVVVVLLLGMTPTLFKWGFDLQEALIKDQTIGKIILGDQVKESGEIGRSFSANLYSSFVDDESKDEFQQGLLSNDESTRLNYGDIKDYMSDTSITGIGTALFCLIVGGIALWMFLTYTIATATRVVQLMFLELIAPIPIISYISSKKENAFQAWVKQCASTYLDLFIRMFIFYIAILMIQLIMSNDTGNTIYSTVGLGSPSSSMFLVYIMLILGVLLFMKKAPQLIEELFPGLKSKASLGFGITGKDGAVGMAKGALGFFGGAAVGGATRAVGRVMADKGRKKALIEAAKEAEKNGDIEGATKYKNQAAMINKRRMLAGAFGGAALGVLTGANVGRKSGIDGKVYEGLKTAGSNQNAANQKYNEWRMNAGEDATIRNRIATGVGKKFGTTEYGKMLEQIKMMENSTQVLKANAAYGEKLKSGQDSMEDRSKSKCEKGEAKTILSRETMDLSEGSDDSRLLSLVSSNFGIDLRETNMTNSQVVGMAKSLIDVTKSEYDQKLQQKIKLLESDTVKGDEQKIAEINAEIDQIKQEYMSKSQVASANYNEILKLASRNNITQIMNEEPGAKSADAVLSSQFETCVSQLNIVRNHINELGLSKEEKEIVLKDIKSFKDLDEAKVVLKNLSDRLNDKSAAMENQIAGLKIEAERKKANDDYYSGSGTGKK